MPAVRTSDVRGIEVCAVPEDPPDPVYWTGDAPIFEISLTNSEDAEYNWKEDSYLRYRVVIDGDVTHSKRVSFGPIEKGETGTVEFPVPELSYEGHAVLEVSSGAPRDREDGWSKLTDRTTAGSSTPIYAFSVWDESHYTATVRRPKQLQAGIIFTSVVLIGFAAVQLYLA